MDKYCVISAILYIFIIYSIHRTSANLNETEFANIMHKFYEKQSQQLCNKVNLANWEYEVDLKNKAKQESMLNSTLDMGAFEKKMWEVYFYDLSPDAYKDPLLRRQAKLLKILGSSALEKSKLAQLTNIVSNMTNVYSTAKICPFKNQKCDLSKEGLSLDPDIETIMKTSTNYDELKYVWKAWHDATGAKMKDDYKNYVDLYNEAAKLNGFGDAGAMWRESFESPDFVKDIDYLWAQIEPLYDELHIYVGRKLKERYGDALDISDDLIPAHVFGNMWAQTWENLGKLVKPFPDASDLDGDALLKANNFTVLKMYETADDFYRSMGLFPNAMCYDTKQGAMIEKPKDGREVVCHASAWDFCDQKDFRIKMCTQVTFENFVIIHHEMGHIQYYQQYKDLPITFRSGANPGFHEAIGDTIALSVSTPKHLQKIGLLKDFVCTPESSINALMKMALEKIAFMPFGLLVDKWRWDVFSGSAPMDKWNEHWWNYREKYQKVKAPVVRTEADFDPGAKFHVPSDSQYISYFVAHVLQFQFYKSLCIAAGQYSFTDSGMSLHECDFYQSTRAGDKLSAGLKLGASKHWSEVLSAITGEKTLDASAMLEYFEPLMQYLKQENLKYAHKSDVM